MTCTPVYSLPGVWHKADGTPKKGGLKWEPRATWGTFWGDSKGGGCDSSLQKAGLSGACGTPGPLPAPSAPRIPVTTSQRASPRCRR